jgi:hypothetical protein
VLHDFAVYLPVHAVRPHGSPCSVGGIPFKRIGGNRWTLGVTFMQLMRHHTWWNLGTRVVSQTTVTTVRVVHWPDRPTSEAPSPASSQAGAVRSVSAKGHRRSTDGEKGQGLARLTR